MKVIRIKTQLVVVLSDGSTLSNNNCTDALYNEIMSKQEDEDAVLKLLAPELQAKKEEVKVVEAMLEDFKDSKYLTSHMSSIYIKSISELSVPQDLAKAIYVAEKNRDQETVDSYLNFWTLACLNPDSRARVNLFWFLKKYGMTISKSGLFIAYRNVKLKKEGNKVGAELTKFISDSYARVKFKLKKSPKNYFIGRDSEKNLFLYTDAAKIKDSDSSFLGNLAEEYTKLSEQTEEATVYTDGYTGTFNIQIGVPVTMPREKCDSKQDNTCSRGLHVAGRAWLENGYFGNTSLMVLVNPADVVAVPPSDGYGKMRVCAYYPTSIIERDENGKIIDAEIEDGFEDDFLNHITYEGKINEDDENPYVLTVPNIPEISRATIMKKLNEISSKLSKKVC